jgi:hypothetical protein
MILLNINRSLLYYERAVPDDTCIANAIADLYAQYPVYGYRRLTACLKRQGYAVNGRPRILWLPLRYGIIPRHNQPHREIGGLCLTLLEIFSFSNLHAMDFYPYEAEENTPLPLVGKITMDYLRITSHEEHRPIRCTGNIKQLI